MDDVDIDVVGLEASKAAVDLAHDVHSRAAEIVWARVRWDIPTFEVMTTSSRQPAMARPRASSEAPP